MTETIQDAVMVEEVIANDFDKTTKLRELRKYLMSKEWIKIQEKYIEKAIDLEKEVYSKASDSTYKPKIELSTQQRHVAFVKFNEGVLKLIKKGSIGSEIAYENIEAMKDDRKKYIASAVLDPMGMSHDTPVFTKLDMKRVEKSMCTELSDLVDTLIAHLEPKQETPTDEEDAFEE